MMMKKHLKQKKNEIKKKSVLYYNKYMYIKTENTQYNTQNVRGVCSLTFTEADHTACCFCYYTMFLLYYLAHKQRL